MADLTPPAEGHPLISVIVPTHNRAHLIRATIQTAFAQDAGVTFEVIVVDDCSDDETAEVAEAAGARVVRHTRNRGPGAARNSGLEVAAGEWIAFLDSDDVWLPGHLRTLWAHRTGVDLVSTSAVTVTQAGRRVVGSPSLRLIRLARPSDVLRPENVIPTSGCMIRTEILRRVGGFKAERYAEDLEMWLHVLSLPGTQGVVIPAITVGYRSHEGQTVRTAEMLSGTEAIIRQLVAIGWLSPRMSLVLRTVGSWDEFRRAGVSTQGLRALSHVSLWTLARLIWGRTMQKQRWRLQAKSTRETLALLG